MSDLTLRAHLSEVIRRLADVYKFAGNLSSVSDINAGNCYDFGRNVVEIMNIPGLEVIWGDSVDESMAAGDSHAVLRYEGRYYDAEHPDGVDDIRNITYFRECQEIADNIARK